MSKEIFIDEAGYTGPDLVNVDQPVFVLASTAIEKDAATDLLNTVFGQNRNGELKHSKLSKTNRGRRQLIEFFEKLLPHKNITFFAVHKEYALVAFLIDFWLEPMAHLDGLNLYEEGANIATANVAFMALTVSLKSNGRRELLRQFQVMTRDRTPFAYDSFWDAFGKAAREHKLINDAIGPLRVAHHRLGWRHLLRLPPQLLDLGDYGLLDTINYWRGQFPESKLQLIHDRSAMIEKNLERWKMIIDPNNPAAVVGQDRRTIEFPLPVSGIQLEDSTAFPQLQVADLVAGAAVALIRASDESRSSQYTDALEELDLMAAVGGGIWPSTDVAPEDMGTDGPVLGDAADFIAGIIRSHNAAPNEGDG